MSDLRPPRMEDAIHDIHSGLPDGGHEFLRLTVARSLEREKRRAAVERAVEVEVIPRLVLTRPGSTPCETTGFHGLQDEIKQFAETVLARSDDAAGAHIEALRAKGIPLEAIYLKLVAPTARYLKYQWLEDERDFADVTLALCRLQQLLRQFSLAFRNEHQKSTGLRALLAAGPGEPHDLGYLMFGLVLLGEFFRRDGWDTWIEPASNTRDLSSLIHNEWFDVVEFMVSGEKRLEELAATIKTIRRASMNESLGVLVCGQAFVEHPELVLLVGGDARSGDPGAAATQARNMVRTFASRE